MEAVTSGVWYTILYVIVPVSVILSTVETVRKKIFYSECVQAKFAQIVVLGELGHSPRMQYHACSMLSHTSLAIELIGYRGSDLVEPLRNNPKVSINYIPRFRSPFSIPYAYYALLKLIIDGFRLFYVLICSRRPQFVLVQTPPAVPTLLACVVACSIRRVPLIVDFHNLGYTLMRPGRLAQIYFKLENFFARKCDLAICVSSAMREFLLYDWRLSCPVLTLYDRPGPQFKGRLGESEKQELFARLEIRKNDFDALVVSATSWTDDEDFGMLLTAMEVLETSGKEILFFITGKGANKAAFEEAFFSRKFRNVSLRTGWLETSDYPKLLGAAEVGVSMHTSSSGLDLPMKVVDMLGAELPVVAVKFPAIKELVDGDKGEVFDSAESLAAALLKLLNNPTRRAKLTESAKNWRKVDFQTHWKQVVLPSIQAFL